MVGVANLDLWAEVIV